MEENSLHASVRFGRKAVTPTDKNKYAYVLNKGQYAAILAAGYVAGNTIEMEVVGGDRETVTATFYESKREGSGRPVEARLGGEFISQWLDVGDDVIIASIGPRVFALKVSIDFTDSALCDVLERREGVKLISERSSEVITSTSAGDSSLGDGSVDLPTGEADDYYSDSDLFKISSWGADLSFRELISRYDEDELVKPELQRNYVWDKNEASRFIDSILLGLPVPSIFLAKTQDEKLLIIDGYQRLMTVRDFVKGVFSRDSSVFRLSKSDRIHEKWRGKSFPELHEDERRKIRNTTIHAIVFMQQHPASGDTSLFQVFERINSNGRTLLPQEIRNCVYQGQFNSLLIDLNENKDWRALWGTPEKDVRMRDLEYILRFFALSSREIWDDENFPLRISLKKYLNQFMARSNGDALMRNFYLRFTRAVKFCFDNFGESAFHNISSDDDDRYVRKFSPTVFDAIIVSVDRFLSSSGSASDVAALPERKISLLRESDYQKLLYQETMRTPNIRARIDRMFGSLFGPGVDK